MTNGIFKPWGLFPCARAQDVMSTQYKIDFEWSVKLIHNAHFCVGIASMIKPEVSLIWDYDPNSVLYSTSGEICVGSEPLHSNLAKHKDGDVIRFRFQPQTKKLLIDLVRLDLFLSA